MSFWGTAIGGIGSLLGGLFGEDEDENTQTSTTKTDYSQLPGYAESDAARGSWWNTLQGWGASGDYGASDMNWDEIYNTALKNLNQFYGGSALTTGLMDKVKASAARRGVSDSPALENTLAMTGIEQAGDVSDLTTNLNTQKAQYQENARNTWLNSIANLSNIRPQYGATGQTTTTTMPESGGSMADLVSGLGSSIGSAINQKEQQSWYEKLLKQFAPATTQASIT